MKRSLFGLVVAVVAGGLAACSHLRVRPTPAQSGSERLARALLDVKAELAPDPHYGYYRVGLDARPDGLVVTGEVASAQARARTLQAVAHCGVSAQARIQLLPEPRLGDKTWGIACLSVASGREAPAHKAEMGTQVLMGQAVRLLKRSTNSAFAWYLVLSPDGYPCWLEQGTFVRCTRPELETWQHAPLLIVTALEDVILEQPCPGAQPVSDVVAADLVRRLGQAGDWFHVQLPDGRSGYLPERSAQDFGAWKAARHPTPENIERTARLFIGRPYLWGGYSPKGLDCSGFTKLVFYLNGLDLDRNASQQARQGTDIPLQPTRANLKKGDLLFFGQPQRPGQPEHIRHVGIYLGHSRFIQSSERVQISSLDPGSNLCDEFRIRTLLRARRILPQD